MASRFFLHIITIGITVGWVLGGVQLSWPGQIYRWTDDEGNIGFTDDPVNIPEKYREGALFETLLPPPERDVTTQRGARRDEIRSADAEAEDPKKSREYWQDKIKGLKAKRRALEERQARLKRQLDEAGHLLISGRFNTHTRYVQLESDLAVVNEELEAIDRELQEEIPEEARKLDVPPGWLRE